LELLEENINFKEIKMLDLLLENGLVADGTGGPLIKWNVGILDDQIMWLGRGEEPKALKRLNVEGLIISPGFIDVHTHSDLSLLHSPSSEHKLLQGITTEVIGNCGISVAPIAPDKSKEIEKYTSFIFGDTSSISWEWRSLKEYLAHIHAAKPAVNVLSLVAHGMIRISVMGLEDKPANENQIDAMKELTRKAMIDGAFGISTGLQYTPGSYATIDELVQLTKVVGNFGGIYCTHMRSQGTGLLDSVSDSIRIGQEANVPIHISHFLAMGKSNWNKYDAAHELIKKARRERLDITYDMYPYEAGCTMLRVILPPWVLEGGNEIAINRLKDPNIRTKIQRHLEQIDPSWDNISAIAGWENLVPIQLSRPENKMLIGRSLKEISNNTGRSPFDTAIELLISERMEGLMIAHVSSEDNVSRAICGNYSMFGSDSIHTPENCGHVHPRTYGAYPRYFAKYVRTKKLLRLEECIKKATSIPAARFGLHNRGLIREGMKADLVIFDPDKIEDRATYLEPRQLSYGINHVIVNGKLALENSILTDIRNGKVLYSNTRLI
jgi:N-acyl-D-amino-acid deacylase